MMVTIFTVLVHATLLLAAVGLFVLLVFVIFRFSTAAHERIMRALATACGLLIYVGAKAVGISIPELVYNALQTTVPVAVGLLGVLLPSAAGLVVAWYVVRYLNSNHPERNVVGMRLLSLVMTFVFFLYCDAYVASYGSEQKGQFVYLLPNLSFVVSILLYAIFRFHPYGVAWSAAEGAIKHEAPKARTTSVRDFRDQDPRFDASNADSR